MLGTGHAMSISLVRLAPAQPEHRVRGEGR
jgi:hypothetical protein